VANLTIENEILRLLRSHPLGLTTKEIAEKLNVSRNTIAKYVEKLKEKGILAEKRVGAYRLWLLSEYYQRSKLFSRRILIALSQALLRLLGEEAYKLAQTVGRIMAEDLYPELEIDPDDPFESIADILSNLAEGVRSESIKINEQRGLLVVRINDPTLPEEFLNLLSNILKGSIEEIIEKRYGEKYSVSLSTNKKPDSFEIVMEIQLA